MTRTVTLDWTDQNSGALQEDEFRVYRSTSTFDVTSLPAPLATLPADTVTYDDTTAEEGETYWYAVAAVKGSIIALSQVVEAYVDFVVLNMRFDPVLSGGDVVFSTDRRSFEYIGSLQLTGVKSAYARSSGKYYFEAEVTNIVKSTPNVASVGLMRVDFDYQTHGNTGLGVAIYTSGNTNGRLYVNTALIVDLGTTVDADVYGFAVDLDAGLFWARRNTGNWNANAAADPATGAGGISIADFIGRFVTPAATVYRFGEEQTWNFETADFTYSAPSGFGEWPIDVSGTNDLGFTVLDSVRSVNVTMSGGNLTATRTATNAAARGRDYQITGKLYAEFTVGAWAGSGDCVGLATPLATTNNIVSNGSQGCYCYRSGAIWVAGTASGVSLGTVANGDRVDMAIDMDARLIWFRRNGGNWNNSGTANPATGAGGLSFAHTALAPCIGFAGGANGNNVTANFGSSAFAGTPPAGFTEGWPIECAPKDTVLSLWVGSVE